MTRLVQRGEILLFVSEAIGAGARQSRACTAISLSQRTLQRRQSDPLCGDQRPARLQTPKNKLGSQERERLPVVANPEESGHLPPSQIVPIRADHGQYIASEATFYRVLKEASQLAHRGAERPV